MIYYVAVGERTFVVELGPDGVKLDGDVVEVDLAHVDGTAVSNLLVDHVSHRIVARGTGSGRWSLHSRGRRFEAEVLDERARTIREMTGGSSGPIGPRPLKAPMPGLVVKVEVEVGDVVEAGQGIAIVEAVKMENELKAAGPGRVHAIHVTAGDTVEKDQLLVEFVALDEEGAE